MAYYEHCVIPFSLEEIYTAYAKNLEKINPEEDLKSYATNYGTGMSYAWPEFEVQ